MFYFRLHLYSEARASEYECNLTLLWFDLFSASQTPPQQTHTPALDQQDAQPHFSAAPLSSEPHPKSSQKKSSRNKPNRYVGLLRSFSQDKKSSDDSANQVKFNMNTSLRIY